MDINPLLQYYFSLFLALIFIILIYSLLKTLKKLSRQINDFNRTLSGIEGKLKSITESLLGLKSELQQLRNKSRKKNSGGSSE